MSRRGASSDRAPAARVWPRGRCCATWGRDVRPGGSRVGDVNADRERGHGLLGPRRSAESGQPELCAHGSRWHDYSRWLFVDTVDAGGGRSRCGRRDPRAGDRVRAPCLALADVEMDPSAVSRQGSRTLERGLLDERGPKSGRRVPGATAGPSRRRQVGRLRAPYAGHRAAARSFLKPSEGFESWPVRSPAASAARSRRRSRRRSPSARRRDR